MVTAIPLFNKISLIYIVWLLHVCHMETLIVKETDLLFQSCRNNIKPNFFLISILICSIATGENVIIFAAPPLLIATLNPRNLPTCKPQEPSYSMLIYSLSHRTTPLAIPFLPHSFTPVDNYQCVSFLDIL